MMLKKSSSLLSGAVVLVIAAHSMAGTRCVAQNSGPEGLENYQKLEKIYINWRQGLFGSRKYHERKLNEFLWSIVGKEITTDNNYILTVPVNDAARKTECKVLYENWLYINGEFDEADVKKLEEKNPGLLKKMWRTNMLVSLSGKIRYFRLGRDKNGPCVELYLEKVRIITDNKKTTKK